MNPIFKKLNFKDQPEIVVVNAPGSFLPQLEEMKEATVVKTDLSEIASFTFFMAFVKQQQELDSLIEVAIPKAEGDALIWFCYPKKSSKKYACDFNRDTGWQKLGDAGYEGVRMVAIDDDWSALRFRKVEYIKTMKRGFAMSDEGKKRRGKK